MPVDTRGFRKAHDEVRRHADDLRETAATLPSLTPAERDEALERILAYLRGDLQLHMKLDERLLYPEITRRLGDPLIAASMRYDHIAVRRWVADLEEADRSDTPLLQRLLYGLEALIRVHVWKEDELFLGPLKDASWPG